MAALSNNLKQTLAALNNNLKENMAPLSNTSKEEMNMSMVALKEEIKEEMNVSMAEVVFNDKTHEFNILVTMPSELKPSLHEFTLEAIDFDAADGLHFLRISLTKRVLPASPSFQVTSVTSLISAGTGSFGQIVGADYAEEREGPDSNILRCLSRSLQIQRRLRLFRL
jgi:hypothetical protein